MKKALVALATGVAVLSLVSCKLSWYVNSDGSLTKGPKLPIPTIAYTSAGIVGTTSTSLDAVTLYYTLDGTEPTRSSTSIDIDVSPSTTSTVTAFTIVPTTPFPSSIAFWGLFVKEGWLDASYHQPALTLVRSKVANPTVTATYNSTYHYSSVDMSVPHDAVAKIYYTTDKTDPTEKSTLWASSSAYSISVDWSTVIKARAYEDNFDPSDIVTAQGTVTSY